MMKMVARRKIGMGRMVLSILIPALALLMLACRPGDVSPTPPGPPPLASDTTLHLIVVADTTDRKIGRSVAIDSENLQDFFKSVADQSEGRLKFRKQVLEGHAITRANVLYAVDNITVYRNDVIIFSYSGHGYRAHTTDSPWPMMNTKDGSTDFAAVIAKIKQKQPRQFIALADCCNNFIDRVPEALSLRSIRPLSPQIIKCMFVDSKVKIAASGSEPGQYSYGNDQIGGFFTSSFLKNLEEKLAVATCSWEAVFVDTSKEVKAISEGEQQPQYKTMR
jgi:hypothetical protein